MEPFRLDVDMCYATPSERELEQFQLRALTAPTPTCNGHFIVRLYGERVDIERWLDDCYNDEDGAYRSRIEPTGRGV